MNNQTIWKLQKETRELLKEIRTDIRKLETTISNGYLLTKDKDTIYKEYIHNLGIINGLRRVERKLSLNEDNNE